MPSGYQKASLNALLALFLEAQGHVLPGHTQVKSPSSLSRFLNRYRWSTCGFYPSLLWGLSGALGPGQFQDTSLLPAGWAFSKPPSTSLGCIALVKAQS
jgi:hypothetical protein